MNEITAKIILIIDLIKRERKYQYGIFICFLVLVASFWTFNVLTNVPPQIDGIEAYANGKLIGVI